MTRLDSSSAAGVGSGPSLLMVVGSEQWAREGWHLRRRAVTLIAEGCAPTLVVPELAPDPEAPPSGVDRAERRLELPRIVAYGEKVPFWLRSYRLEQFAGRFERQVPDLLWACGPQSWRFARDLARRFDRPLALECRFERDLLRVKGFARDAHVAAIVTPCEALARAARTLFGESLVRLVPLGVPVSELPRRPRADDRALSVTMLAAEAEPATFAAMLRAFAALCAQRPETLGALELPVSCGRRAWRLLGELDLRSLISTLEVNRMPLRAVESADLLLTAERCGGPRIETLVGLGLGLPVIAAEDPFADALVAGETACIVPGRAPEATWLAEIDRLLDQPQEAAALGERARRLIAARHRTPVAGAVCATVIEELTRGPSLRYSPQA